MIASSIASAKSFTSAASRSPPASSERIDYDLAYVDRRSLRTDVSILLRTVFTVVSGDGIDGHDADDPLVSTSP